MATEITEYSKTEAALTDLKERYGSVIFEVATKDGMALAVKGRAELRGYRIDLEKERVRIKAPALERCRLIDTEAKRITGELVALEDPIDGLIKAEEGRKEAERQAKVAAELERTTAIQARIAEIRNEPAMMAGKSSGAIQSSIDDISAQDVAPWAQEFAEQALAITAATIAQLSQMRDGAKAQEEAAAAEAKRIADERAELAKLRAEQEERARQAAEVERKQAAEESLRRQAIEAAERASREKIEAEERAARLAREEADRQAEALREAERAKLRHEQELEAARLAAARAEEDRARAEEEAKKRQEAEVIAQAQAERDSLLRAEQDRLESVQREANRLEQEILDANAMLQRFVERFEHVLRFAKVIKAIRAHLEQAT